MIQLDISTPALLFPAISLLLIAHTSRFLTTGQLIRGLNSNRRTKDIPDIELQIKNLSKRMELVKYMQAFGAASLLFCTISMGFLFFNLHLLGDIFFFISIILMGSSMVLTIYEIMISTEAIKIELKDLQDKHSKSTKNENKD
jgi:hypothetical protein